MKMNRTNTAGRLLALLLLALMMLSLTACGTKNGDKADGMSSEPMVSAIRSQSSGLLGNKRNRITFVQQTQFSCRMAIGFGINKNTSLQ